MGDISYYHDRSGINSKDMVERLHILLRIIIEYNQENGPATAGCALQDDLHESSDDRIRQGIVLVLQAGSQAFAAINKGTMIDSDDSLGCKVVIFSTVVAKTSSGLEDSMLDRRMESLFPTPR